MVTPRPRMRGKSLIPHAFALGEGRQEESLHKLRDILASTRKLPETDSKQQDLYITPELGRLVSGGISDREYP